MSDPKESQIEAPGRSSDPKKAQGDKKCPLHLIPTIASRDLAEALNFGANVKGYGEYNWREGDGVLASVYIAAMKRHLDAYLDGEDCAADSGVSHLGHLMAGGAILIDATRVGKLIDDRPVVKLLSESDVKLSAEELCAHHSVRKVSGGDRQCLECGMVF